MFPNFITSRIFVISFVIYLFFLSVMAKLVYISLVKGETYAKAAVAQRQRDTQILKLRGVIYDRNMLPLTESSASVCVAINGDVSFKNGNEELIKTFAEHTNFTEDEIKERLGKCETQLFNLNSVDEKFMEIIQKNGAKIVNSDKRYSDYPIATHLIGYAANSNIGGSGVEKAFNKQLEISSVQKFGVIYDAKHQALSKLGQYFDKSGLYDGVRLTIDYHAQKVVEDVADRFLPNGAIIITEVKTGDILAMVSRPNFQFNNYADYLSGNHGELINRALTAYDVGSIFKIVTSAAAIENENVKLTDVFYCPGNININGITFRCNNIMGHKTETFKKGFADSCNIPFFKVGIATGFNSIIDCAKKFGFGKKVLNIDNFGEQTGNLPSAKQISNAKIANLAIGQGELMATPLQVVNAVNVIANNGVKKQLNIAQAKVDKYGKPLENLKTLASTRIINIETALSIKTMMKQVVEEGTGKQAKPNIGGAGGKTSSAETGWFENGEFKTHAWFAGYYPVKEPQYSVVVFVENGKQGATAAAPIFKVICDKLVRMFEIK